MAEFNCYVAKGSRAKCGICGKKMEDGKGYCRVYCNSYANPYFHANCLANAAVKARTYDGQDGPVRAKIAAEKKARAGTLDKMNFLKRIIREAVKSVGVKTRSLSITRELRNNTIFRVTLPALPILNTFPKTFTYHHVYVRFSNNYTSWSIGYSTQIHQSMADPEAIKKMGEALKIEFKKRDWIV